MENEGDRQEVLKVFETELAKDKVKANVLGFTSLGLLEVTRKKVRPSLQEQLQQVCPECEGMGLVVSRRQWRCGWKGGSWLWRPILPPLPSCWGSIPKWPRFDRTRR